MYYSKPLKSYEAVCQVLDQAATCDAKPVHWRKPLYASIDELTELAAPAEQIKTVEQLTIVLLKLEWAIQRAQADKIEASREQLAQLTADWRSMVEADIEIDIAPVQDAPTAPPRSIAQLQDLLAEAAQDTHAETEELLAPPRWLSFKAPQDEAAADAAVQFTPPSADHAAEATDWTGYYESDDAADDQDITSGYGCQDALPEELRSSDFSVADDYVEAVETSGEDLPVAAFQDVVEEAWAPRNEGLPFGKPSAASQDFAAESASASYCSNPFADFERPAAVASLYAPDGDANGGIDFGAASRNDFAQARIDFRDPFGEEEIESVAEALERITVPNRYC